MTPSRDSTLVRFSLYAFFFLLACYALYEAWGMLYGPSITVPEETVAVSEAYTLIKGRAERITELRLNGGRIPVTEAGDFQQPYVLAPGTNYLILEARDARGRTAERTITIVYEPPPGASVPTPEATTTPR